MPVSNTTAQYGSVAKVFHWLTALGIFLVIPLGIIANDLPYDTAEELAQKAWLFSLHKTVGITIFFVALARIVWALTQPKPAALHPDRKEESLAAETVHWLLYGSLVLVPLSGWVHHAATEGFAPIWWPFGQNLPLVPESNTVAEAAAGLHIVFERVLILSLLLHIAGAVKHAVIDKDGTLSRMWFGAGKAEGKEAPRKHGLPAALAIVIWAAALGIGGTLGVYQKGSVAAAVALQEVESDWQVRDGTLAITVQQMGSAVRGEFATWTAQIAFDDTVTEGVAGNVTVEVAIASLSLGSVTNQAMGADYFNAEAFPTAQFTADILNTADGYVAEGTLALKGVEQPITLPFELTLDGPLATMEGSTTLNRQNYGIGDGMTDENQLAFDVVVNVALTAQRGE
ncbi:cytochrome b/b6 domain-containing protein [Marivita hallyeonensis]|uniref:Cytochrome b561 n=1 Tax=Marivita hallyeonensis TaxID=996342 RepID=A0A1M5VRZ6_9RHOB|nr:cytochrome b/b6 domain-containing protein [Marivita hallyeonensis]SHH77693.1 Cytochrome b561 [Marivita hallyeonensis]